ncbi:MAG: AAA family ATPase [Fibrobacteres bacterium]|jgi:uncharacterized protein YPO0396|nr:AAA family ATPase [Fibrobacterota bacterium]
MADLFSHLENAQAGWRLSRLEILNWGTFDGPVWKIAPAGLTSLLTGDNGSGKSTVVDAILTLLVPPARRSYNLASGSEKRKERDESSYVLGAFGQERDETTNRSRVKTHRERATARSVLLAVFENDALKASATLAQSFWYEGETLKKLLFVGERDLSVRGDFLGQATPAELRRSLKSKGHVTDTFRDYQQRFEKIFGLRSEKALALFNQTVSLKAIGSLTAFVREHMLDAGDSSVALDRLRESHEDLSRSHEAILTARRQQEILDPLAAKALEMSRAEHLRDEDARIEAALPRWSAERRIALVGSELDNIRHKRHDVSVRLDPVVRDLAEARADLASTERDLASDETGRRIHEIEREERSLQMARSDVQARRERLRGILDSLAMALPESDAERSDLLSGSAQARSELDRRRVESTTQRDLLVLEQGERERELGSLRREFDSLRERRTQIPEREIRLRRSIAEAVGCPDEDLPFAGELLRVRETENVWEPAIERLLHGFALRLLVPPRLYRDVRDHVDRTHLGGRLVFHRAEKPRTEPRALVAATVGGKVEIKSGTPHRAWLATYLSDKFDHLCCESLDDVPSAAYALTRNGLVRGGESQHEKDDRHRLDDRSRWVLGWTNEEKVKALAASIADRNGTIATLRARRASFDVDLDGIRRDESLHERLPELLRSWEAIDLESLEARLASLRLEREALSGASDVLSLLRERLLVLRRRVEALEESRRALDKEDGILESRMESLAADMERAREVLASHGPCEPAERERIESEIGRRKALVDLAGLEDLGRKLADWSRKRQQERSGEIARLREAIVGAMGDYLRRFPADSADLASRMEYLESFLALHRRVTQDDLPRHEQRFRELLRDSVVREVSLFRNQLEKEERSIRSTMALLNASLARIPYTSRTHLQLLVASVADEEIRSFKADLRDCIGDLGIDDETANEERFLRIRKLLKRLQEEERWRRKVIDVRNWLEFSASELLAESGEEVRHYPDSAGLSGGQKAKLAYTVLASGLAWHFGLEEGEVATRSLRFVVIDEAFSRSDDESSRFCLDLFRKLDLQLLVVTPSDKIHVVEPFIATCHYVWYDRDTDKSQVCDLSLAELHDRRALARRALRGEVV